MLRTVGPGVLTLMTITFFLLLTLVHRMADVFTWVVVEPFLLRRTKCSRQNNLGFCFRTGYVCDNGRHGGRRGDGGIDVSGA
jgi:hypothetical protein